ncbi:TonB-dependent receptor [Hyphococcus sp.]|uniref:TonB-dependent receptor n=1 Tax=Hyphococcus sp. TaxID=2038636 RepID=UPI0035C731F0
MCVRHFLMSCVSSIAFATAAQAQEDNAAANSSAGLDNIVVTAQRQSQNLQSAPLSITAVTGETLEARGINNVQDLALQTPSLAVKTDFGAANPNIYIRGVGIGDFNANVTGAVGVYIDEVYQSSPAGQLFQFFDTERVEVLRGPQGTLYGRNTTGGAINFLSRRPTDELSAYARALYGRYDEAQVELGVGGPIVPGVVKARISGTYHRRDGTIENTSPVLEGAPERFNDLDTGAMRLLVDVTPSDAVELKFNVHYGRSETTGLNFNHRGLLDPATFTPCSLDMLDTGVCVDALGYSEGYTDPDTVQYNHPSRELVEVWGGNLKADIAIGEYSLTSISAYEDVRRDTIFDGDDSPNDLLDAVHRPESTQFTQEVRIASPTEKRFYWLAGGYYFNEDLHFDGAFDLFREVRPAIAAAAADLMLGLPLEAGFNPTGGPDLAAMLGNPIFAYPTLASTYSYDQKVESWAFFGQAYYRLADSVTLTGGLRYSEEDRTFDYMSALVEPFVTIPLVEVSAALGNNKTSFDDLSWRGAIEWQATEDVFFYASASKGSKSGGFNGAFMLDPIQAEPFGDESLRAYEAGVKSEWLDSRLRLNATGFYYDYRDLQVYSLESTGGIPQQVLRNAPKARVYGAELELLARPVEALVVSAGLSLLDSEITADFIGGNGANLRGNELAYAPKVSTSGSATYTIDLPSSAAIILSGDYSYQSRTYTDTRNLANLRTGDGVIVGLRAAYRTPDGRTEIAAWGKNITNTRYITYVADLGDFGFNRVQYTVPATYGVSVRFNY